MTTKVHDSNHCDCEMCQFASKSPSEPFQGYRRPSEGEKIDSTCPSAPRIAISALDFEHEWQEAPESHKRYTERECAEYFYLRGVRAGELNQMIEENRVFREMAERRGLTK